MNIYRVRLYSYFIRNIKNRETAEDLLQETLIKVWKGIKTYREEAKFSSWLFSISHNILIDYVRKQKMSFSDIDEVKQSSAQTPYEDFVAKQTKELIEAALKQLSENQQEVFYLRQHSRLAFKEIAARTNQPLNTVLSHMNYAVKKIKKILREENVI